MMRLLAFKTELEKATTPYELKQLLMAYFQRLGISTFSFTYYSYHPNAANKLKYDCCSKNFVTWHQHYLSENYEEVDSTLGSVNQQTLPIFWDLKQQLHEAKSPRERQMRLDSIEFGAEKGLSIPIHGPHEDFANLLVVQMKGEDCLDNWQLLQYELLAAAHVYYHYVQKQLPNLQAKENEYKLTEREIQCLVLVARRASVIDIAEQLEITERTVNYHIQKVNKKLGVKNKHQAVTKALEKSLIIL